MWFKKKKDDKNTYVKTTSFDDLKTDIKKLQENNSKLNDELSKLQRIIKNSKDEPTFILDGSWEYNHSLWAGLSREYIHKICLYINKEEYIVKLDELLNEDIDMDSAELEVKDNIAYFSISACMTFEGAKRWTRHKFIIEYKNGRYVYSQEEDEERNNKEEVKLQIG